MEDRVAIEQLWAKYAQALDTADPELYAEGRARNLGIMLDRDHHQRQERAGRGNPPVVLKMGRYEDELVKKNGKWLYDRRVITGDLQMPRPALN